MESREFGRQTYARRLHFGCRRTVGRRSVDRRDLGRPSSRARDHLMQWRHLKGVVNAGRIADPARRPDGALGGARDVN
jgi:hypothetical protein